MTRVIQRRGAFLALVIGLPLLVGAGPGGCVDSDNGSLLAGVPVQRGDLHISVVQRGNLEAKDAVSIASEIEGRTTILYLINEGTHVTEGELLVELDASALEDRKVTQEILVQNAEAAFTKAKQQYEIQKSENESSIDAAKNTVQFSEMDLNKYLDGDWPQQLQVAAEEIVLAEEEKARAEERLNWSRDLAEKGFLTRTELEGDELAFNRSEILLQQAKRSKELLIEYDNPRQLKQLEADLAEARRELQRTEMRSEARLVDFEAALNSSERKLDLEREKLEKTLEQIERARIVSPVDGMVVYTREGRGRWGSDEPMQEGSEVRERQEILTIPTANGLIAEASVHESVLKQVVQGLRCEVTVDALPGLQFDGTVEFVAPLPDQNSWWANPNTRLFRTRIAIDSTHAEMRPGMSCSIEFLIDDIEDALYVPLQAVNLDGERTLCFVETADAPEPRDVEVGRSNDKYVEIKKGLSEGELVPPGFTPKGDSGEGRGRSRSRGKGDKGDKPATAGEAAVAASKKPTSSSGAERDARTSKGRPDKGAGADAGATGATGTAE